MYEQIHEDYESHYYDKYSMKYRDEFMYNYILRGLDLNNSDVAEIASGSGHNTNSLLKKFPQARIEGYDISEKACVDYRKKTGCKSYQVDLTKENFKTEKKYDFVLVIGGLHHLISDLPITIKNIHSMLKPDGLFLMVEPSSKFFLQGIRDVWYKLDKRYFEPDTEGALDHDELTKIAKEFFTIFDVEYKGGPAHMIVYNSMVFRMPKKIKHLIAPPLFLIEKIYNKLPSNYFFSLFYARWKAN